MFNPGVKMTETRSEEENDDIKNLQESTFRFENGSIENLEQGSIENIDPYPTNIEVAQNTT